MDLLLKKMVPIVLQVGVWMVSYLQFVGGTFISWRVAGTPNTSCGRCGKKTRNKTIALSCGKCNYETRNNEDRYCSSCQEDLFNGWLNNIMVQPCEKNVNLSCDICGGDGLVDKTISCPHGHRSRHSYCGHGRVGQHD